MLWFMNGLSAAIKQADNIILDGYPRTVAQAKHCMSILQENCRMLSVICSFFYFR